MKPVDQTKFGSADGNCLMACLASILECSLEELPELTPAHDDGSWWNVVREAARERGWWAIYYGQESDQFPRVAPQGYAIAGGRSPRLPEGHCVVALDGMIVHDPHPSRVGLDGPIEDWIVLLPPEKPAT